MKGIRMQHRLFVASMAIAIAFVAAFASCGKVNELFENDSDDFKVTGTVTDGAAPLPGVVVTSPKGATVTDPKGAYELSLPEGSHPITFKSSTHGETQMNVIGKAGDDVRLDVALSPTGSGTSTAGSGTTSTGEYVFAAGKYVEQVVNPNGGWIEFEVWIPESGRKNDWGFAAVLEMYQGVPNRYASFLPYKIKTCAFRDCREPRYNLPWNQWRKVRFEWSQSGVAATIDGTRVSSGFSGSWAAGPVKLCYGHRPHRYGPMTGVKMRNIVWSK